MKLLRPLARRVATAWRAQRHKWVVAWQYAGSRFECPFCGGRFGKFMAAGLRLPALGEKKVVGGGYRTNAKCPRCSSYDRERLIYLYLKRKTGVFRDKVKLLHVAPEENLRKTFLAHPNIDYLSADLDSPLAMVRMDVTRIPYEDSSFDMVVCNHVLEHVPDDRRAMRELYRVLKPGGWAVLQVPVALALDKTTEDPGVTSPEERERLFGQRDHVRLYGRDYKDRLEGAGFSVEVYDFAAEFGAAVSQKHALLEGERIYRCSKHPGDRAGLRVNGPAER
jgi:SAM-dependent methyltransferase